MSRDRQGAVPFEPLGVFVSPSLVPGGRAAIFLGLSLNADLILIDERRGANIARKNGFVTIGTLGVLDLAAERELIDLKDVITRLAQTNFRYRPDLIAALLRKHDRPNRS
jgi:predicted nucleic acid-binding protein